MHQYSQGEKVGNFFAQNYSFMTNGSDAPKIEVSFHLLMFADLNGLWCEGEGLSYCVEENNISIKRKVLKYLGKKVT